MSVSSNMILHRDAQGEIWASSCSLCGGAVRPIAGGLLVI